MLILRLLASVNLMLTLGLGENIEKQEKWDEKAMKCDRNSEDCCKEAKFKVDVYKIKRVDKGNFIRYERGGVLSELFLCEDHTTHFQQDKVNYGISEIRVEDEKDELEKTELSE
jgi:hypothetical protein